MLNNEHNPNNASGDGDWRFRLNKEEVEIGVLIKKVAPNLLELLDPLLIAPCQSDWSTGGLSNAISMTQIISAEVDHRPFFEKLGGSFVLQNVP